MRKLLVGTFLTLDGVMQAPGAPDEDRSGGFEHGGGEKPDFCDVAGKAIMDAFDASGGLAQTLMENDLVDEYRLMIHPVVLGTGKRLFRDGNPKTSLRLVESTVS